MAVLDAGLLLGLLMAGYDPASCDPALHAEPQFRSVDYAADIQPLWNQFCANCHVQHAGNPAQGLDLDPPFSRDNLVWVPSSQDPGLALVWPGLPAESLLMRKLQCSEPGPLPGGAQMPLGRPALDPADQARVYDWIAAGAPIEVLWRDGFDARL